MSRDIMIPSFRSVDKNKHPEFEHIGLVYSLALKYNHKYEGRLPGMDIEDLVIIGWMALQHAWKMYKKEIGPFHKYACKAIAMWYKDAIRCGGDFVIPIDIYSQIMRLERGKEVTENFKKRSKPSDFKRLSDARHTYQLQRQGLEAVKMIEYGFEIKFINKDALEFATSCLDERSRQILDLRYGLKNGKPMDLRQIGLIFSLSKERIRQIEIESIDKMREALVQEEKKAVA